MSLPLRLSGPGSEVVLLPGTAPTTDARQLTMRAIEVRFAAAMVESALPKSQSSFGKGLGGSVAREHLVDRIAEVLADSNALGIAKAIELRAAATAAGTTGGPNKLRGLE
jgi:hypothetical protein